MDMDCTSSSTVHSSSPPSDQNNGNIVGKRDADKDIIDEGSKDGSESEGSKITDGNEHRTVKEEGNDDRTGKVTSMDASVAIIGAGIAGLSAAHQLKLHGFTKVTILEASNRTGGRIYTHTMNDCIKLELGAQWIHGQEGNPLFDRASKYHLLDEGTDQVDDEKSGIYCTEDGQVINESLVNIAINKLDSIKEKLSLHNTSIKCDSVGEYFREQFQSFLDDLTEQEINVHNELDDHKDTLWSLFNWYMTFECIDNACKDLNKLSSHGYKEWYDCPGTLLVNFKSGYGTIIQSYLTEIPKHWLKLNEQVTKINLIKVEDFLERTNSDDSSMSKEKVEIITANGTSMIFDHIILTMSLGCLKYAIHEGKMFQQLSKEPSLSKSCTLLSDQKIKAIENLGYGTINKIFLIFDFDYWPNDFAVKFVWKSNEKQSEQFPEWVYDISGFDLVRGRKDVLLGWIGGHGAEVIETISDGQVGIICTKLLKTFLPSLSVEEPKEVIVTKWFTNKFFRGSYSHRTVDFDDDKMSNLEVLQEPVVDHDNVPRILFAGEATDREFYSSTHGALRSGIREADRLIKFLNQN